MRCKTECISEISKQSIESVLDLQTHLCVMSAADSAHHGSACIATTEHMLYTD